MRRKRAAPVKKYCLTKEELEKFRKKHGEPREYIKPREKRVDIAVIAEERGKE